MKKQIELPKIRTSANYVSTILDIEFPTGISATIPNQVKSVKEVLIDFSRGINSSISKIPSYDENPDLDMVRPLNIRGLDPVDLEAHISNVRNYSATGKNKLKAIQNEVKERTKPKPPKVEVNEPPAEPSA